MFVTGISDGEVSWLTTTQLPERLAPVDIVYRASAYWRAVFRRATAIFSRADVKKMLSLIVYAQKTELAMKSAFVGP
ncbi:hypothetical protein ACFX13_032516 [Malus domestica]